MKGSTEGKIEHPNHKELSEEILRLKKELNAVILAHNYQRPEIQEIADFVGDSLALAQYAAKTTADTIVFCGVRFMAETAKILNPHKFVLLPDKDAGCSLEESCPAEELARFQQTNPNFYTIAYINCSAAVKALSDVICTSGNAELIVKTAPHNKDILFVPDKHLGSWVMEKTGRKMTLWNGECEVHVKWTIDDILALKGLYPEAPVVAHPECIAEVRAVADIVCSTEKMIHYCKNSSATVFIIVTEVGMLYRLQKICPDKRFISVPLRLQTQPLKPLTCSNDPFRSPNNSLSPCNECKYMKLNTLEKLYMCMSTQYPRIELPADIIEKARRPLEKMFQLTATGTV